MFPEEERKAKELIDKFKPYAYTRIDISEDKQEANVLENARQCALVCWDEILKAKYEASGGYMEVGKRMWHDRMRKAIEIYNPPISAT